MKILTLKEYTNVGANKGRVNESTVSLAKMDKYIDLIFSYIGKKFGGAYPIQGQDEFLKLTSKKRVISKSMFVTNDSFIKINFSIEQASRLQSLKNFADFRADSMDVSISGSMEPEFTIDLTGMDTSMSFAKILPALVEMIKTPRAYMNTPMVVESVQNDFAYKLNEKLSEEEKLQRAKDALADLHKRAAGRGNEWTDKMKDLKSKYEQDIALYTKKAEPEKDVTPAFVKVQEVFDAITTEETIKAQMEVLGDLVEIISTKVNNALLITGGAGTGKTTEIELKLQQLGLVEADPDNPNLEYDYVKVSGGVKPAALYSYLYKNREKLFLFDDGDMIFRDRDMVDMMKIAMADNDKRVMSWISSTGSLFDPKGKSEDEIAELVSAGKFPNSFKFKGQIIFASNMKSEQFTDDAHLNAIYSRSTVLSMDSSKEAMKIRMGMVLEKMCASVGAPVEVGNEVLGFLDDVMLDPKFKDASVTLRSLKKAIQIRSTGKPNWKSLAALDFTGGKVVVFK